MGVETYRVTHRHSDFKESRMASLYKCSLHYFFMEMAENWRLEKILRWCSSVCSAKYAFTEDIKYGNWFSAGWGRTAAAKKCRLLDIPNPSSMGLGWLFFLFTVLKVVYLFIMRISVPPNFRDVLSPSVQFLMELVQWPRKGKWALSTVCKPGKSGSAVIDYPWSFPPALNWLRFGELGVRKVLSNLRKLHFRRGKKFFCIFGYVDGRHWKQLKWWNQSGIQPSCAAFVRTIL